MLNTTYFQINIIDGTVVAVYFCCACLQMKVAVLISRIYTCKSYLRVDNDVFIFHAAILQLMSEILN
jgi:hypothetical protein